MNIKKILALLIPLFIAGIFISSYISNTNFSSSQSQQTTTVPQTVFGQGVSNAMIIGYGSPLSITVACANSMEDSNTVSNVTNILTNMESNNSISTFYNSNLNFQVAQGNLSSYGLYKYFQNSQNATQFNCLNFTGPAYVALPPSVEFVVGTQKVNIPLNSSYQNTSITMPLKYGIGTQVRLKVSSLITANGTLYGPLGLTVIS